MENMQHYESDKGTPQGGLISPILANVYLHYVLDLWFELYIKIKCKGGAYLVRYADGLVHHTSGKKSKAKKQAVKLWLIESVRIYNIPYLIEKLNIKLQGTFRYYGVSDNFEWMMKFRNYVIYQLREQLSRRSQKGKISWEKLHKILEYNPIVMPKIYHSMWQ